MVSPKSLDEDSRRKEFILNIVLLGALVLLLIFDVLLLFDYIIYGPNFDGMSLLAFSMSVFIVLALYLLSRWGYFKFSAYVFVAILFVMVSYAARRWGLDLPAVLMGYALITITSSVLIGVSFGFWLTCAAVTILLWLGYQEIGLGNLPDGHWKTEVLAEHNLVEYSVMLLFLTLVSWLSNHEMEKSLRRARGSEAALKLERDNLEIIVAERTRELRQSQFKQLSEHAQFVELGRLAGGYVHDLANPLTTLSLSMDQLSNSGFGPASQALTAALNASRRMQGLVTALRRQIRNDIVNEVFSLNQELKLAGQLLGYKAKSLSVQMAVNIPDADISLFGSPSKFYQIVSNLIINAMESFGSKIFPETRYYSKTVEVTLHQSADCISLSVSDNGLGIESADLDKIFQPFFTTKPGGLGIGLPTIKSIVENDFRGTINVVSLPGKGTVFTVELPLTFTN